MASDDEDDYVVFGSPLLEEEAAGAGAFRRPKQDPAATKALPVWQQEVTDAEGRRRFHGAFTGGYSAGFFNTVGSKEGWAPREFRSTRGQRAESRAQTAEDFMDDDELQEAKAQSLRTTDAYDTFGHAAGARAREAAAASVAEHRPGLPSAVPLELVMPVPDSIGIRLLQRMGWRQGKGVGQAATSAGGSGGGGKWGRMASLGAESAPLHTLPPKQDTFGLGFDPYQGAEEFRAGKRPAEQAGDSRFAAAKKRQKRGIAFSTGAMDEDDSYGVTDDYVTDMIAARERLSLTIVSDEEDDDRPGFGAGQRRIGAGAERLALPSAADARRGFDLVPGFVRAREAEAPQAFPPPRVPRDFVPRHTFAPRSSSGAAAEAGEEPPQPRAAVLKAITTIAPYVARVGPAFEALAIQKNAGNADFAFLTGGEGAAYYRWRVRAAKAAAAAAGNQIGQRSAPLTADSRGAMLGEVALASAAPAAAGPAAAATAGPGAAASAAAPAAPVSIAAGDRAALQETLQSTFARGSQQDMGFSRGVGLQPGAGAAKGPAAPEGLQAGSSRFASSGTLEGGGLQAGGLSVPQPKPAAPPAASQAQPARGPKRTVQEWQPPPLLCKRFNVPDPFKGRRTAEERGPALRVDALALPETAAAAAAQAALPPPTQAALPLPPPPAPPSQQAGRSGPERGQAGGAAAPALPPPPPPGPKQQADLFLDSLLGGPGPVLPAAAPQLPPAAATAAAAPMERPIDLFKAIFENGDESEEEPEEAAEQPQQGAAAAAEPLPQRPAEAPRPAAAPAMQEARPSARDAAQPSSGGQGAAAPDSRPAPGGPPAAEPAPGSSGRSLQPQEQRPAAAAEGSRRPTVEEALALLGSEAARDKKRHREKHKHKKEHKKSKKSKKERHRD